MKHTIVLTFVAVAACSSGSTGIETAPSKDFVTATTVSGFRVPGPDGLITEGLLTGPSTPPRMVADGRGNGYAYSTGKLDESRYRFAAFAGILPTTSVTPLPTTGTVQYEADYRVHGYSEIVDTGMGINGMAGSQTGTLMLLADLNDNSLTGTDGLLAVDGQFSNARSDLTGAVNWNGLDGELTGLIGSDKAIGAFHGSDAEQVYSGGFIGNAVAPQ